MAGLTTKSDTLLLPAVVDRLINCLLLGIAMGYDGTTPQRLREINASGARLDNEVYGEAGDTVA